MKALNYKEVKTLVDGWGPALQRAQLQDVFCNERGLVMGFRQRGQSYFLVVDLNAAVPAILFFEGRSPWKKISKPKPLSLFLKSHALDGYFQDAKVLDNLGRVVLIRFISKNNDQDKVVDLEVQLIPKQANIIVRCEGKSIAWDKPKELVAPPQIEEPTEVRSFEQIHQQWLMIAQQSTSARVQTDPKEAWDKQRLRDIEKKKKALQEIEKQIQSDESTKWYSFGDFLKTQLGVKNHALVVPEAWNSMFDSKLDVAQNMERAFHKAKQIEAKKTGTLHRRDLVLKEIQYLENAVYKASNSSQSSSRDLMKQSEARGRKLNLEGGLVAYLGRSAADNLAILRAAKAWDLWFHLRDYPGAHAVIHRHKDQKIPDQEIQKVALWVAKESSSAKNLQPGSRLSVVLVECRFVRPIKGDKAGKVTYTNAKTIDVIL